MVDTFLKLRGFLIMPREITIVENQFKSSGPQPNELQVAEKGLWYIDQVDLKVYKLGWVTGEIPFEDQTDTEHSSGITLRGRHLWIASSCELKLAKPGLEAGETIGKYDSPGAEVTASREGIEGAQVTRLYRFGVDRQMTVYG